MVCGARKVLTVCYRTGVVLAWLALFFLAVEVGQRAHISLVRGEVSEVWGRHAADGQQADAQWISATLADAEPPPAQLTPNPAAPPRAQWDTLSDPAARAQLAKERQEAWLLCDRDGMIREWCIPPNGPARLTEWVTRVTEDQPVWKHFRAENQRDSDALARDVQDALRSVCGTGADLIREYPLCQPDGTRYVIESIFAQYPPALKQTDRVSLVVRESIYEELWRRFRPHKFRDDDFSGWIVWTNNAGYRGPDIVLPKPAGVYRIACVGGSTTFEGARNHLTYPAMLQKRLREHFHTDRIEVVNCGVNALNSFGELQQIDTYLSLQPDLIIHYNFVNDLPNLVGILRQNGEHDGNWRRISRSIAERSAFLRCRFPRVLIPGNRMIRDAVGAFTLKNESEMIQKAKAAGAEWVSCSFACPDIQVLAGAQRLCFNHEYNPAFSILGGLPFYSRLVAGYNGMILERTRRDGGLYIPVAEELSRDTACFIDACHLYTDGIAKKADVIFRHVQPKVAAKFK